MVREQRASVLHLPALRFAHHLNRTSQGLHRGGDCQNGQLAEVLYEG